MRRTGAAAREDPIDLTNGSEAVDRGQRLAERVERAMERRSDVRCRAKDLLGILNPQLTAGGKADDEAVDAESGELPGGLTQRVQVPGGHLVAVFLTNHDPERQRG